MEQETYQLVRRKPLAELKYPTAENLLVYRNDHSDGVDGFVGKYRTIPYAPRLQIQDPDGFY